MVSAKQLEANRRNALKSTGPKTDAGKKASSGNAMTHGLTSKACPILPGEDAAAFDALHEALVRDLQPRGILQREVVRDLAQIRWKLRRVPAIEAEIMAQTQAYRESEHRRNVRLKRVDADSSAYSSPIEILANAFVDTSNAFERLDLYRMRLMRSMHTALRALRTLRDETAGEEESGGEDVHRDTGLRPVLKAQMPADHRGSSNDENRPPRPEISANVTQRKNEPISDPKSRPLKEKRAAVLAPAALSLEDLLNR